MVYLEQQGYKYQVEKTHTKEILKDSENPSQNIQLPTRSFLETCLETAAKLLRFVKFDQLSHNYNRVKVKRRYSD